MPEAQVAHLLPLRQHVQSVTGRGVDEGVQLGPRELGWLAAPVFADSKQYKAQGSSGGWCGLLSQLGLASSDTRCADLVARGPACPVYASAPKGSETAM